MEIRKVSFVIALFIYYCAVSAQDWCGTPLLDGLLEEAKADLRVVKTYKNYKITDGVTEGKLKISIKNFGTLFEGSIISEINFEEFARQPIKLKSGKTQKIELPLPKDYKSTDLITIWAKGESTPILYNEVKGNKNTLSGNIGYENVDTTDIIKSDTLYCYVKVKNNGEKEANTIAKVFFMSDAKTVEAMAVLPYELKAGEEKILYPYFCVDRPLKKDVRTHMKVRLYYEDGGYDEGDLKEVVFPADN